MSKFQKVAGKRHQKLDFRPRKLGSFLRFLSMEAKEEEAAASLLRLEKKASLAPSYTSSSPPTAAARGETKEPRWGHYSLEATSE